MIYYGNFSLSKTVVFLLSALSVVGSGAWNMFQKRGMHFIHLNINNLQPKIDEIRYVAKLTNATVIGLSETKLDNSFEQ